MTNIIKLRTSANPDDVLEQAIGVYEDVLILGYDKHGLLEVRASDGLCRITDATYIARDFIHKAHNRVYTEVKDD